MKSFVQFVAETVHYLDKPDPLIRRIVAAAYPDYRGTKYSIEVTDQPIDISSYWDGGSRDRYVFVSLADFRAVPGPDTAPLGGRQYRPVPLPPDVVCVRETIYRGKNLGVTVIVHPRNAAQMIPASTTDATPDELIVVAATRMFKSSYAGVPNFRYKQAHSYTKITPERWDAAKASATEKGYLNRAGAITPKGRNLTNGIHDLYQLKDKLAATEGLEPSTRT